MLLYYVYAYLRKSDLTPYYIGKGIHRRAFDADHRVKVPTDKSRIVFIETNMSEIGALAIERRVIRWYGRKDNGTGILRNMTDGGDGASGAIVTPEVRARISAALTGRPSPKKGIPLLHRRGIPVSEETKEKIRIANTGENNPGYGKPRSDEVKAKMSASKKGKPSKLKGIPRSDETKAKIGAANKGRLPANTGMQLSQETKDKISASKRASNAAKRLAHTED